MEVIENLHFKCYMHPVWICFVYDERTLSLNLSISWVTLFSTRAHCAQPHAVPFV